MRTKIIAAALFGALLLAAPAWAQRDPAAARELAKQAYDLKRQKSWEGARAKFEESQRLDPQPKTLINLAECESELGKLVDAQGHLVEARDGTKEDAELNKIAKERLSAVEKRMPRLMIRLASDAPSAAVVARDGVTLGAPSLGTSLPTDPGKHVVVAKADGRAERVYEITLAESETRELEVAPGAALATAPAATASPAGDKPPPPPAPEEGGGSTLKTVGIITAGVGVVGLGVGVVTGLSAKSQRDDAHCPNSICANDSDAAKLRDAKSTATLSTVFFIAGGVLAAGGVTLWLLAPSSKKTGAQSVRIGVAADRVLVGGAW